MYREQIRILADAGVDLIAAETMISIGGTPLPAIDAANSVCSLPILCTVTVEADGSIFSGGNAAEAAAAFESAGADAVGINCSVGPDQLVSVVRAIREAVSVPVVVKPNAGMPTIDDFGNAVYNHDSFRLRPPHESAHGQRRLHRGRVLRHNFLNLSGSCPESFKSLFYLYCFFSGHIVLAAEAPDALFVVVDRCFFSCRF